MAQTKRARIFTLLWLAIGGLALLSIGAVWQRQAYLTRGIPEGLPPPIVHAGAEMGLNVALNQYDDAALAENLAQIAETAVQFIKQPFYFSPDFDWAEADRLVRAAAEHNLTLVPLLDGNPANDFAPPADPNEYALWAAEFANRYGSQIQYYIIWDEPNLTTHWGNQPVNPAEYAALLTAVFPQPSPRQSRPHYENISILLFHYRTAGLPHKPTTLYPSLFSHGIAFNTSGKKMEYSGLSVDKTKTPVWHMGTAIRLSAGKRTV